MSHQRNVFDKFYEVRGKGANSIATLTLTVAASQTIKKGDLLGYTSGAQTVEQLLALASVNAGTASGGNKPIVGMALESITTAADGAEAVTGRTKIQVAIWNPQNEFALRVYNSTAADSEPQDLTAGTTLQLQRWTGANTSTWWYSLITTTTNGEAVYLKPCATVEPSEDYGPVWVRANISETIQAA